jgi:1-deoxy-D-xylulose-5-phosphate synthase
MDKDSLIHTKVVSNLLKNIASPLDIKGMTVNELEQLAGEVRHRIIDVISKNGGHLASSLGVVELTIALHYVYNAPADRIIWDVGHQCYAHKILTGRNDKLGTIRKAGGIAGFPSMSESPYDCFNTGHAGTSISAALGFAQARDLQNKKNKVIAVIGDGSLSAGIAFEGLNNAGSLHTNLTVVLNDNEMSISANVGALSQHLNRIITGKWFVRIEQEWDQIMKSLAGDPAVQFSERFRGAIKGIMIPGKLFEDLGYKYIGPIEGHEISYLIETFQAVKDLDGPKLVHVVTKKGKGYQPAEERATSFHGVSPFDPDTGSSRKKNKGKTYTDVFSEALVELAGEDEKIVAITAAMPDGTGLTRFAEKFPDRFFDVGIAEQHATTFAAGLAVEGLKPVVAIYSTFMQRVFDQIIHDVCLTNQDVTFAVDRAGIVGEDGATHQGAFDLSFLRIAPNMIIMAPKDEQELRSMLKTAIEYPGPAALRYPRGAVKGVKLSGKIKTIPIGKAELLKDGDDLCVMAIGRLVAPAVEAAKRLEKDGYSVAVVNARYIKPLDVELIARMGQKCGRILTIEENALAGGFGSALLELLESEKIHSVLVRRLGIPDKFIEHSETGLMLHNLGLDTDGIENSIREFIDETRSDPDRISVSLDHAEKTPGHPSH